MSNILKIPHHNYIKTLIVSRNPLVTIKQELKEMNLGFTDGYILKLKDQMYLERTDYFDDHTELVDVDWLEDNNIDKMYAFLYNQQIRRELTGITGAIKILEDVRMYRIVTSLALCNITDTDIELIVNGKYDIDYSVIDIQEFINYFFDIKEWTKKDKQRYITTIKDSALKKAYTDALVGDKNKLLWKLKLSPNIDWDEMLREIMTDSFYQFKDKTLHDPDMALKFANLAVKVSERLEKSKEEQIKAEELKNSIEFDLDSEDQENIISFDDLQGTDN